MTLRVSCPFCNTGFDLAVGANGRVPCPRCGESFAVKPIDGTNIPQPSLNGDGVHPEHPVLPVASSGLKPLVYLAGGLFAVVALGIGLWLAGFLQKAEPKPPPEKPQVPGATWPPQTLAGLRYLPTDSQVVFAFQPGPLLQYAERTKQDGSKLLADGGMPKQVFQWLTEVGVKPENIDHVAVGVKFEGIPPFAMLLALREPLAEEGLFLQGLKARRDADKKVGGRDVYRVSGGALLVPVDMVKVDTKKYLFASNVNLLATAEKPHEGMVDFPKSLQDSIRQLSPSSFFWLATDTADWTKDKTRSESIGVLAAIGMGQGERWKKFDPRLRSTAVGLSLEEELKVKISARYTDSPTAELRVKEWVELVTASKGEATFAHGWATATVPLNPTDSSGKVLKLVYTP